MFLTVAVADHGHYSDLLIFPVSFKYQLASNKFYVWVLIWKGHLCTSTCKNVDQVHIIIVVVRRGSQSKPVKRVVHPKVVHSSASSVSDDGLNKNNNMDNEGGGGKSSVTGVTNVESITAAVAASAAVAATQPFLKV